MQTFSFKAIENDLRKIYYFLSRNRHAIKYNKFRIKRLVDLKLVGDAICVSP